MKRIKLKALTFGIISSMIFGSISPIFASDSVYSVENQSTSQEGTFETKVYAQIGSEYLVTIPKSLTLSGIDKTGKYEVKVDGDMASEELVKVIPDSFLTLSSPNKESQIGLINQDKIEWTYKDLDVNGNGTIIAEDITAGKWNGTFNFNINIEIPQILVSNAINKNNETVIVQTNSVTGVEKNDLLNALEQSGQIESAEDIETIVNVSTTTNVDKIEINLSGVAKPGDTVVVVQEKTDEWDYVSTETVDNNNKVTVDVTNSNPVSFIETKPDGSIHVHVYEEKVAQDATCTTDGVLLMACECDRSYSFAIPASHDIEVVEKKDENGNLINKYYECKNCDYSILNLTKLFAGEELSHDCNDYLVTKYDTTNHWKECSACGIKLNTIKHTFTTTGTAGCAASYGYQYNTCSCGYSYQLPKKAHTTSGNWVKCTDRAQHYKSCTVCGVWGTSGVCKNSNGQVLGCTTGISGTCASCGAYRYGNQHGLIHGVIISKTTSGTTIVSKGELRCISNCGQVFGTYTLTTNKVSDTQSKGTLTLTSNINLPNLTIYNSNNCSNLAKTGVKFALTSSSKSGNTITATGTVTHSSSNLAAGEYEFHFNTSTFSNSLFVGNSTYIHAPGTFKSDWNAPTYVSSSVNNAKYINEYATSSTITAKYTENYSTTCQIRLLDSDKTTVLSNWKGCTKSGTTFTGTLDVADETTGTKTVYVQAKDTAGNLSGLTAVTLTKLDSKPPVITTQISEDKTWSKTKDYIFSAIDKGSGALQIAFNNINEYVDMTANGTTYSKEYQFSGDVYGEVTAAIYYKDAAGNVSTQFVKIHNLDNTAPTITNYSLDNKTITIEANDLNSELNLEGSGITGYALTWSPAQPQETDWQSSNQIQISGSGIYYLWAKDLVGNVSKPYKIKVIL